MEESMQQPEREISFKEFVYKLKEYWLELWKSWLLIALFCIPFLIYFAYQHFQSETEYKASLTYMLNTNDDNSMAGFASLLGSFGINRGSRSFSLDKLVELSKSRTIVQKTLFNRIKLNDKTDFIGNHLIDFYGFQEKWSKNNEALGNFYFTHSVVDSFSSEENFVLKSLYAKIVGNASAGIKGLLNSSYNEDSGILKLDFQSTSEELSAEFANRHFEELRKYFIDKTIEKQLLNYEIMDQKTDSLQAELNAAEFALANFKDSNLGIYTKKDKLTELRLEGKIQMLYAGLAKALENREIADFTLKYQTPFIQTIDRPVLPLDVIRSSLLIELIKALILGCLLGSVFVVGRKLYRDAMA